MPGGGSDKQQLISQWARSGLEYLRTSPGAMLTMFRILQEPQRLLLQAYLHLGGAEFQDEQLHNHCDAKDRSYAALVAESLKHGGEFISMVTVYMTDSSKWDVLHHTQRTASSRGLAFRALSCSAACVFQFLSLPRSQFPYTLFKCYGSPAAAAEAVVSRACARDPWSKEFMESFPDIMSERAQLELSVALDLLVECISTIESRHAVVRRQLMSSGVQTHRSTVQETSASFVFTSTRRSSATRSREPTAPTDKPDPKAEGRRGKPVGFGGPRHAYVRRETLGTTGRPDLGRLARQYADLTEEELEQLKEAGRAAHHARKHGAAQGFGPSSRDIERDARRRERQLRARRLQLMSSHSTLAIADAVGAPLAERALVETACRWDNVVDMKKDLRAASSAAAETARQQARRLDKFEADAEHDGRKFLVALDSGGGPLAKFAEAAKGKAPLGQCSRIELGMQPVVHLARLASSLTRQRNAAGQAMAKALSSVWDCLRAPILMEDCPKLKSAPEAGDCVTSGHCVCSEAGRRLERMRVSFCSVLKSELRACVEARAKLSEGKFAVRLCGARLEVVGEGVAAEDEVDVRWCHWAYHHGNPWRPTFQLAGCEGGPGDDTIFLRGLLEWASALDVLSSLDADLQWTLCLYGEFDSARPLGSFKADGMLIQKSGSKTNPRFWPPHRKRAPRRRQQSQRGQRRRRGAVEHPAVEDEAEGEASNDVEAEIEEEEEEEEGDHEVIADADERLENLQMLAEFLEEVREAPEGNGVQNGPADERSGGPVRDEASDEGVASSTGSELAASDGDDPGVAIEAMEAAASPQAPGGGLEAGGAQVGGQGPVDAMPLPPPLPAPSRARSFAASCSQVGLLLCCLRGFYSRRPPPCTKKRLGTSKGKKQQKLVRDHS